MQTVRALELPATSIRILRWRIPALVAVLALVALHELFLSLVIPRVSPDWRLPVEVTVYGLTGIVAAWLGLTVLARVLARREKAEADMQNAFKELEFNHQRLLALHDLGENLAEVDDEQSVLELAAQAPGKLVGAQASTVVTIDRERDRLKLDMAWGLSDPYLRALRAQMDAGVPAGRCASCSTLRTETNSDCPMFAGLHEQAKQEGIGSLICLPINHERIRVGFIAAYFPSAFGPPEDHIRLLNILGGAIAGALHSLRIRAHQVDTLHALDRASQTPEALNDLAAQMLEITAEGWQASSAGLFLYDAASQLWTCHAQRGLGQALTNPRFTVALELARKAQAVRQPVIFPALEPGRHDLVSAAAAPLETDGKPFGAIVLASQHPRAFIETHTELLGTMAHQIALAIHNVQLYAQINQLAVYQERYRISREIHDGLAQTLGYLGLQAERLENLLVQGRVEAAGSELVEMRQTIRAAYVDVREAIDGLRLSVREPGEIAPQLKDYVGEFARQSGLVVQFTAEPENLSVDSTVGTQLLRIAQEALTNVRKHASARRVEVHIAEAHGELELTITDDGRGFPDATERGHSHHRYGLTTMRERAESLNGRLAVATGPGQGTRIAVTIPTTPVK
ncbi:MAG: GAF domain-containing protein [Anaerolineae bacterium]